MLVHSIKYKRYRKLPAKFYAYRLRRNKKKLIIKQPAIANGANKMVARIGTLQE